MGIRIDINCDMGEGMGNEADIMPYISSANIACGYHAGDEQEIRRTMQLAQQSNVSVGAHPSFNDRENFGRVLHPLTESEIYALVTAQLQLFAKIARSERISVAHVKPHGALYNWSAAQETVARVIASAIKDVDERLIVYGLSGSLSIREAEKIGLQTVSEVFADRTYQQDGSLTPRDTANAVIQDEREMLQQALTMVGQQEVVCVGGKRIPIKAESICIHGDGLHAVRMAAHLHSTLQNQGIRVIASNQ